MGFTHTTGEMEIKNLKSSKINWDDPNNESCFTNVANEYYIYNLILYIYLLYNIIIFFKYFLCSCLDIQPNV